MFEMIRDSLEMVERSIDLDLARLQTNNVKRMLKTFGGNEKMGELQKLEQRRTEYSEKQENHKLWVLCEELVQKSKSKQASLETIAVKNLKGLITYGYPEKKVATIGDYPCMKALLKGFSKKAKLRV